MKKYLKISPFAPAFSRQLPGAPLRTSTTNPDATPGCRTSQGMGFLQNNVPASAPRWAEATTIYVVDSEKYMTELYTIFLEAAGYIVRAFNRRDEALAALQVDRNTPDLLVMDYSGHTMTADRFIRSLLGYPTLRILMASGYSESDVRFSGARPHRFVRKPFTLQEFQEEVRVVLTA